MCAKRGTDSKAEPGPQIAAGGCEAVTQRGRNAARPQRSEAVTQRGRNAARPECSEAVTQRGRNAARPNRAATRPLPIPCSRRRAGGAVRQRFSSLSRCLIGYRASPSLHLGLTRIRVASRSRCRCPSPAQAQASAGSAKAESCAWETRVSLSCFQWLLVSLYLLVSAGSAKAEACAWAALGQAGAGVQPGKQDGRVHDKVSCPCPALLGPSQRSLPAACPELVGTLQNRGSIVPCTSSIVPCTGSIVPCIA